MTKRRKFIIIIAAALLAAAGAVIAWLLLRSEGYHPFSSLSASDIALCHADGATSYTETAEGEKASMPAVYMLTQEETDELLTLMHKITYEKNDDGEDNDLVGIPYKYFTVELKNGEKISKGNAENKNYSTMSVTISWEGESHDLSECLTTTRGGSSAPKLNMVFSGNPKAAAKTYSGCMVCLDSCYIGIVSNSEYGLCDIDNGKPTVFARSDVLPDDGTVVDVTFKLK